MNVRFRHSVRHLSFSIAVAASVALVAGAASAVEVVCHRGANEYAPENTQAAAQLCIDWGVEYVEVDVRTSQDGVLYILHDFTVDRTTNGKGPIAKLNSEEIDRLDAGSWFDPKFKDERVPRLEPYLNWIRGKAKVYFDVKACDLQALIDTIYRTKMEDRCFLWFDAPKRALDFRKLNTELPLKVNVAKVEDVVTAKEKFQANIVEVSLENMSQELVEACRSQDLKIMVYEPQKNAEGFREIVEWGADMVNLNHGDLFLKIQAGVRGGGGAK